MVTLDITRGGSEQIIGDYEFILIDIFSTDKTGVGIKYIPTGLYGEYFVPCGGSTTRCDLLRSISGFPDNISFDVVSINISNFNAVYDVIIGVPTPRKPVFEVVSFSIAEDTKQPYYFGDDIHLTVSVKNTGSLIGNAYVDILRVEDSSCIYCNKGVYSISPGQTKSFDFWWKADDPILDVGIGKHLFAQVRGGVGLSLYIDILIPGEELPPKISPTVIVIVIAALIGSFFISKPTEQKTPVTVF